MLFRSPLQLDTVTNMAVINPALGNTIQNSSTWQFNANLTMTSLYNKVPFFKKLMSSQNAPPPTKQAVKPKVQPNDTSKTKKPEEIKKKGIPGVVKFIGKMVLCVKNIGATYTETNGTALPGFLPTTEVIGNNFSKDANGNMMVAPGWGFVFGSQKDIRQQAAGSGWLTQDTAFIGQYSRTYNQNITGRATIEPFDNFRIELALSKQYTNNYSEQYHALNGNIYDPFGTIENGSYSITYITWGTAFSKIGRAHV